MLFRKRSFRNSVRMSEFIKNKDMSEKECKCRALINSFKTMREKDINSV